MSDPFLPSDRSPAEFHNYWRRGNVFYMAGKLLDFYNHSEIWRFYRLQEELRLMTGRSTLSSTFPILPAHSLFNSMQLTKIWRFAQDNHLDRERVIMTDVTMASELCLKAIATHAKFREGQGFRFDANHDLATLFGSLPNSLKEEVLEESIRFAETYAQFVDQIRSRIDALASLPMRASVDPSSSSSAIAVWKELAQLISQSHYTVLLHSNDPGSSGTPVDKEWFTVALGEMTKLNEVGGMSEYFRYAPASNKDELPVSLIQWGLMLGRFFYEHLFPVHAEIDPNELFQCP